ncbi:MAG: hypothetical protein QM791_01690 [Ferruginibacter sp.]
MYYCKVKEKFSSGPASEPPKTKNVEMNVISGCKTSHTGEDEKLVSVIRNNFSTYQHSVTGGN